MAVTPYTIDSTYSGGQDIPVDGRLQSITVMLLQILWELRVQSHLLSQIVNGEIEAEILDNLRYDQTIDPHFNKSS